MAGVSAAEKKFSSPCCGSSGLQISAAWIEKCGGDQQIAAIGG